MPVSPPAGFPSFPLISRVITPLRFAVSMVCATGLAHRLGAAPAPSAVSTDSLSPGLAALLAPPPQWSVSTTADLSYGYKDNLLLSATGEERSAFARGSLSLMVLRAPTGPVDVSLFVQADGTRYFSGRTVDHDAGVWTYAELGYRVGETIKFSVPVTGYYSDRVSDVSSTFAERLVSRLKVTGGKIGPTVRVSVTRHGWIEAQASGERKRYDEDTFDARVGEGALRLGWKPSDRVEAQVAASQRWWSFDRHEQYTTAGRALAGTLRKDREQEGQARLKIAWDEAGRWRSDTRASLLDYRDNGPGYFNYRGKKIAQELQWRTERWLVRLEGIARRIDHGIQTVGFGIDPPPRIKDEFSAELQVERTLGKRWTLLAGYTWERSRSNDLFASYRVNEGLLGLRWSWEK